MVPGDSRELDGRLFHELPRKRHCGGANDNLCLGVEGEEAAESEVKPFLQIYCLTGSDRTRQARQENRFILHADATTIYAAEFLDSDWDCGLTQETLKACFHAELDSWNTIS